MHEKLTDREPRSQASNLGDFLGAAIGTSSAVKVVNFPPRQPGRSETASTVAVAFLKALDPSGWHNLVALDPERRAKPEGRTFPPGAWLEMAAWIERHAAKRNVYFSVNEPRADAPHGKLARVDIARIRAVFVDLDPNDKRADDFAPERERLSKIVRDQLAGPMPPSLVTDSGSGFHLFWRLGDHLGEADHREPAEAACRAIASAIGGDPNVHDTARIMRLPGTPNLPDSGKRARGRVARSTSVIRADGPAYSLDVIARCYPPVQIAAPSGKSLAGVEAPPGKSPEIARLIRDLDVHAVCAATSLDGLAPELRDRLSKARRGLPQLDKLLTSGKTNVEGTVRTDDSSSAARFELAGWLKAWHFTPDEFGAVLYAWEHAGKLGDELADWDEHKLRREIARCWVNSPKKPERFLEDYGGPLETPRPAANSVEPFDIFGDADPAELGDLPPGALPPMAVRWTRTEARRKGVPEAFAAISMITAFGAGIGTDIRIQVRQRDDSWTEAANLWCVLVAPPGSVKSPIIAAATAPLRDIDERWSERDAARHAQWAAAAKRRGKDAPPAGAEPPIRRAVVDDMTSEKAIRIFRDNPRGVLQAPDELAGLLGGFGAYKSGGGSDRTHFLRMFDGGSITSDRVGSGTISARRASLSVLAGTQPEKLRGLVRDLGADGLLQRFIVVLHDGRERQGLDEEPDRAAVQWLAASIEALTSMGGVMAAPVRLSLAADAVLKNAMAEIHRLRNLAGASEAFGGHVEKWGKILPRLVLIVHVMRMLEFGAAFDPHVDITAETAAMAVELARFFLRHALRFYSTYFGLSPAASEAIWIAGFLLTRPDLETCSRRDIYDARTMLRRPENLRILLSAMGELEVAGWCSVASRDSSGPKSWRINRRIHERFAERAERERAERTAKRDKIIKAGAARKWVNGDASPAPGADWDIFE